MGHLRRSVEGRTHSGSSTRSGKHAKGSHPMRGSSSSTAQQSARGSTPSGLYHGGSSAEKSVKASCSSGPHTGGSGDARSGGARGGDSRLILEGEEGAAVQGPSSSRLSSLANLRAALLGSQWNVGGGGSLLVSVRCLSLVVCVCARARACACSAVCSCSLMGEECAEQGPSSIKLRNLADLRAALLGSHAGNLGRVPLGVCDVM